MAVRRPAGCFLRHVKGWKVEDPAQLAGVLKQAIAFGGPTLVDIVCQPLHEARAPVSEWVA